jgi:hypothetical protein
VWRRAAELREATKRAPGSGRGHRTKGSHLFTRGLLRCLHCEGAPAIQARTYVDGGGEIHRCSGKDKHGSNSCPLPPVPRALIDEAVFAYFERVGLHWDATRASLEAAMEERLDALARGPADDRRRWLDAPGAARPPPKRRNPHGTGYAPRVSATRSQGGPR